MRQAAVAERIVLTKGDLVSDHATLERLKERLRALNPGARIVEAVDGNVAAAAVIGAGLFDLEGKIADVREWLKAEAVAEAEATSHAHQHAPHDHGDDPGHHHHHAHDVNRHDDRIRAFCLTSDEPVRQAAPSTCSSTSCALRKARSFCA